MNNFRLYFALWPDDGIRLQLARYRAQFSRETEGHGVFPISLHITLAFLGEVDPLLFDEVEAVGQSVKGAPFEYVVNTAGCFAKAGVAVLGSREAPPQLFDLQKKIQAKLASAKLGHDTRTFRPHITVVRNVKTPFEERAISPIRWPVDAFSLIGVSKGLSGPSFEVIKSWRLKG